MNTNEFRRRQSQLVPAIDKAQQQQDAAAQALKLAAQRRDLTKNQLNTLEQFRNDYFQQLHQRCEQQISARELHRYSEFFRELDQGIDRIRQESRQRDRDVDKRQGDWQSRCRHTTALHQVVHGYARQHRAYEDRQEQRQLEEQGLQMWHRRQRQQDAGD